jgi:hypothetical protein
LTARRAGVLTGERWEAACGGPIASLAQASRT